MSACRLKCNLLWAICRQHGWGDPVPTERVLRYGLDSSKRGRGRRLLHKLVRESYVEYYPRRGYRIKNDPDSQALLASRLMVTCGVPAISVEATLSRFEQAGGFDAYDVQELASRLDDW